VGASAAGRRGGAGGAGASHGSPEPGPATGPGSPRARALAGRRAGARGGALTLVDVEEFVVPLELVDETLEPLQEAGRHGYEAFVLWGGRFAGDGRRFEFISAYFPEQTTSRAEEGLLVTVEGEALFRVNRAFYRRGLTLAGQVHSHPTDAYHSDTDDAYPLMTLIGGLSGVVPDFGDGGRARLHEWAWYRLVGRGEWAPLGEETRITFR